MHHCVWKPVRKASKVPAVKTPGKVSSWGPDQVTEDDSLWGAMTQSCRGWQQGPANGWGIPTAGRATSGNHSMATEATRHLEPPVSSTWIVTDIPKLAGSANLDRDVHRLTGHMTQAWTVPEGGKSWPHQEGGTAGSRPRGRRLIVQLEGVAAAGQKCGQVRAEPAQVGMARKDKVGSWPRGQRRGWRVRLGKAEPRHRAGPGRVIEMRLA